MKYSGIFLISSILILAKPCVRAQSEQGDICTLKSNRENGICTIIPKCQSAIDSIRKGHFPQICGYSGTVPIVCCPQEQSSTPQPTPQPNIKPGELAKRKCREYAKYVNLTEESPVLLIGAEEETTNQCGFESVPLIVGGEEATRKEFPHMALIGYKPDNEILYRCGGSIISENFILTAAHCLFDRELGDAIACKVGVINVNDRADAQVLKVTQRIPHPNYAEPSSYHDIGLLKIEGLEMTPFARPACLQPSFSFKAQNALASGWGRIGYTDDLSDRLLKVKLELFPQEKCNHTYRNDKRKVSNGIEYDKQICAGSTTELKDTCQGDSGGPLQIYHDEKNDGIDCMYDIIGVVSFGKACGLAKNIPGVYTRVSNYIPWIEKVVWA